jgi:predicted metal-dependent phosphoesterase TrpH
MRIDLHCHTRVSGDSNTPFEAIPARCREQRIAVQAITDHDEIWGAQQVKALAEEASGGEDDDLTIIVGEEIMTDEGELIGLFLKERVEPGLSPEETVRQIKAQGGLVVLPHGFDPLKFFRLKPKARERIASSIDIVETFNARVSQPRWNRAAARWAAAHGKPTSAGSDAHALDQIGRAWIETPRRPIHGPQDLLAALREGAAEGTWTHPLVDRLHVVWRSVRRTVRNLWERLLAVGGR